jgi:hypothetical protein
VDVLFCVEIGVSFGERVHAISFARQIQRAGYRPHFLVSPHVAGHLRSAGFESTMATTLPEFIDGVQRLRPDMVIGCELFNLSSQAVQVLIDTGKPIGTMDGTTLGFEINADPFKGPEFTRSLVLPERYYSFRPCPVNDIGEDDDRVTYFPLFPGAERVPKDPQRYAQLGLDASRRTVMFAIAPWALGAARAFGLADSYYDAILNRVIDGLAAWDEPMQFVVVAKVDPSVAQKGSVAVHVKNLLRYDFYDHLLCSCDAIVSDNIIQTSVSKAVVMGTPHLVIQNTQPSELPFPCNMFPVKQLFPPERDYARILDVAEFGDPAEISAKLRALLTVGHCDPGKRELRARYVERLRALTDPAACLERILGPAR